MSTLARFFAAVGILLLPGVVPPSMAHASSQPAEAIVDLARIPLPVQDLPEDGYQVMTGGYLGLEATASHIAAPRQRSMTSVSAEISDAGWLQGYAIDHVLLEDRVNPESDILALVQTTVFLFADTDGANRVFDLMSDYSVQGLAESMDPAVAESSTVRIATESGDSMRTVVVRERMVVEIVSLDALVFVDEERHDVTVTRTLDRLMSVIESSSSTSSSTSSGAGTGSGSASSGSGSGTGIMPRAVRLADGGRLAELQDLEQSGVHQIYRIHDGQTQPAAGEVGEPDPEVIAEGLVDLYHASEAISLEGGTAFMSTWIGFFGSEGDASAIMGGGDASPPAASLVDPYFPIARDEQAVSQGIVGLYRVTGIYEGQPYSGTLEIRQHGRHVVAIGFRTIGATLPPVDVTSRVMDAQLDCLDHDVPCAPLDLSSLLTPPMATPVAPSTLEGVIGSEEFGWTLNLDQSSWEISNQFAEPGYDLVELRSGQSLVTLESVIDQHGDPQQCVIDELNMLQELESHAVIELGSDLGDEAPAGSETGHAWAIYRVEPLAEEWADQEYVIRLDCYTLIDGGASLIMSHRAPLDTWADERVRGDEIRGGLMLPSMRHASPPVDRLWWHDRAWDVAA